jgi:DNA-binding NarL/FixJ family response regulator
VLHHVAAGLTNAEIAERLVVAPSTVRKHLENAYRKLGVRNRFAAVVALDGGRLPDGAPGGVDALV